MYIHYIQKGSQLIYFIVYITMISDCYFCHEVVIFDIELLWKHDEFQFKNEKIWHKIAA